MEALPPPAAYVAIDPVAWTQAPLIRWPSADKHVFVYEGSSKADVPLLQVAPDRHEFRMGQKNDRLVVVIGLEPGFNGGVNALRFLAAHESFHLAVQYYSAQVPLSYVGIERHLVEKYSDGSHFADIYAAIDEMHAATRSGVMSPSCRSFSAAYNSLEKEAREYFNQKAFWEWPAEFYAYTVAFNGVLPEYEAFRSHLFADDLGYPLFIAGVKVAELVEMKLGRPAWQERAVNGESMLSMFSSTYACEIELGESPAVTIDRLDFPEDR